MITGEVLFSIVNFNVLLFSLSFFLSLYTEVIKYSTLLKRAKKRNEIFIKKLGLLVK
jgi:hypothetical protein